VRAWSAYQKKIIETARDSLRSVVIVARAGSGKTTTLIEVAKSIPVQDGGRYGVVAFANRSREKIEDAKPPKQFSVSTCHALGLSILRDHNPFVCIDNKGEKMPQILREEVPARGLHEIVTGLVKKAKTRLIDDSKNLRLLAAVDVGGIGMDLDEVVDAVQRVLFMCREKDTIVDFDDMVWLPVVLGLKPKSGIYDALLVDELQDLTRAQVMLVATLCLRALGFGDDAQAIYQFAGADIDAVSALADAKDAIRLPLSISYRCPRMIVNEAKKFVSDIEHDPDQPNAGEVLYGEGQPYLHRFAKPGSLILSRTNAPLMGLALEFAQRGVPAQIIGRDMAKEMCAVIDRSGAQSVNGFLQWIADWGERETVRLRELGEPPDYVLDRVASFSVVCRASKTLVEVRQRIARLFTKFDARSNPVQLSTVHQMKGEENSNVLILRDTFRVKKDEPIKKGTEEANLLYVAITRSKRSLHYVEGVR